MISDLIKYQKHALMIYKCLSNSAGSTRQLCNASLLWWETEQEKKQTTQKRRRQTRLALNVVYGF